MDWRSSPQSWDYDRSAYGQERQKVEEWDEQCLLEPIPAVLHLIHACSLTELDFQLSVVAFLVLHFTQVIYAGVGGSRMLNFQSSFCELGFDKFLVNARFHRVKNILFKLRHDSHSDKIENDRNCIICRQNNANTCILNIVSSSEFQRCDPETNRFVMKLVGVIISKFHHFETGCVIFDQGKVQNNGAHKPRQDYRLLTRTNNHIQVSRVFD